MAGDSTGGDLPPLPRSSCAMSALQGRVPLPCFPVGHFAIRSPTGNPPSYSEHRNSCVSAFLHTHRHALNSVEDSLLPGREKIQEQHQLISNSVLLGRFVLSACSGGEFIESTAPHVEPGCGEWREGGKRGQILQHVVMYIIQQVLVRSPSHLPH